MSWKCLIEFYPNSKSEELILCASWSLSPWALVFLMRSLPAKSQLQNQTNKQF